MASVKAKEIEFRYKGQKTPLFSNIFFSLEKGKIAAITGPSGSGKSTLGYCLSGVIPNIFQGIYSGHVEITGRAGIVFQDPDTQVFLPAVEDELAFAPENLCLPREETGNRINKALRDLGIPDLRQIDPSRLSGGQKQLVALAGVLTLEPDLLILDETLSQLDKESKWKVKELLLMLKEKGVAIILIEHNAKSYDIADEIWLLRDGELANITSHKEVSVFV